jgi:hypothetical protein
MGKITYTMLGTLGGFLMAGGTPIFQSLDDLFHFMGKNMIIWGTPILRHLHLSIFWGFDG